ncbi:MAG: hypothetical protein QME12_00735 [Nanoarchaeota archaeon]|nr:hypothetical protein [Nanoarchaeota archaeon]
MAGDVVGNSLLKQMYPLTVNHNHFGNAAKYVDFVMSYSQKDAIILTQFDEGAFPLLYAQQVEGKRKDIIILSGGILTNQPWYRQQIKEEYPQLNLTIYNKAGVNHIDLSPPSVLYTLTDNPLFLSKFDKSLLKEYSGPRLFMTEHNALPSVLQEFHGFKAVPIPV